jgi:NAD(P)H-hydrate epimerase
MMRRIDAAAIAGRGMPSDELMERAGEGIATRILAQLISDPEKTSVAVFCGKGNNGGDGYVIARHLHQAGVSVTVYFMGPLDGLTRDARLNFDRAAGAGVTLYEIIAPQDLPEDLGCDIVVDAVFGTGFSGAPRGLSAEIIEDINLQDATVGGGRNALRAERRHRQFVGRGGAADYSYPLALPKYGCFCRPAASWREMSRWCRSAFPMMC